MCKVIAADSPAFTMAATPFLADLVKAAPNHGGELDSLRIFVSAGAPIPSAVVEQAGRVLKATIVSAWGMTENGAVTMTCPEDPPERASQTDGKALPYMEVNVTDFQGQPRPAGEEGRLLVRGASLFVGYLKRPELYGVDPDGWFNTGDLARMDPDGYIRITGRTKDVVIRGGENIPVVEVENLLYTFPGIADVALVGCPDERLGERLCAYVTLNDSATELTLDQIKAYLVEQQLAKNYLPEYLEVIEAMPRTASGKIQKFKLRERPDPFAWRPAPATAPADPTRDRRTTMRGLEGKTVIVTGGGGGIGRAVCQRFAEEGCKSRCWTATSRRPEPRPRASRHGAVAPGPTERTSPTTPRSPTP